MNFLLSVFHLYTYFVFLGHLKYSEGDSESYDLLTRLAVVIDITYRGIDYDIFPKRVKQFLREVMREHLNHGELNIEVYTSTEITLHKDTMAVLSIMPCEETWTFHKLFQDEHILHMAITDADCPRLPKDEGVTVTLVSPEETTSQVLLDIKMSQLQSWTSCVVLYDTSMDINTVQKIIKVLSVPVPGTEESVASVSVFRIQGSYADWERRKLVLKVLKNFPTNILGSKFIAVVTREMVGVLMEVSKSVGLSDPENHWLYLISDMYPFQNISSIVSLLTEGENVAFVFNTTTRNKSCVGGLYCHVEELLKSFVIALDRILEDEAEVMEEVSMEEWEFIRPSKNKRRSDILQLMNMHIQLESRCDNCTLWTLAAGDTWGHEYMNSDEIVERMTSVGIWTPLKGVVSGHLFPHDKYGFGGRNLPVVSMHDPPWQIITYNSSARNAEYKGFMFEILNNLATCLNFSYTVMLPVNNKDGWTNDTMFKDNVANTSTTFTETERIIELLRTKKVFLAVGAFTVTERRKMLINFTMPISIQASTLLTSRPEEISRALIFIAPFAYDTWICIVVMMAIITPILNYFHKHSPFYEYRYGNTIRKGLNSLYNCLWYVYGALMQQGGTYLPEADSGRILIGAWWLVVLVIVTSYGGNLVAFLTFPRYEDIISDVEQLMAHKDFVSWGIMKDSSVEDHLKDSEYPKYKALLKGAHIHETQDADLINRVRSGSHVLIDWKLNLQLIMDRDLKTTNSCSFALGTEEFLEDQVAMMMVQRSPYLAMINEQLLRMHQSGLIYKWYVDHLPRKDRCWEGSRIASATTHTVNLDDMQGSFIVLGLGCAIAVISILMEYCYHQYKLTKEKKVVKPFTT